MARRVLPALLLLALGLPAGASAEVALVGGKPLKGSFFDDGNEVVYNPWNSRNPKMTWQVQRFPKGRVKDVRPSETPEEEYCRRAYEARAGEAAAHRELAAWCTSKKLAPLAAREWERALECDPQDAEARKALGEEGVRAVLRRNPRANPALGELLKQYLESENAATRRVLFERAVKEHGLDLPATCLERAWRSGRRPKARTDDVPLTLRSKTVKGPEGVLYTMFVPSTYDPLRPTPLLVGLHGGGQAGKDGKEVVGSGPSAMNFYTGIAEEHGWLVACPTAIQAPWNAEPNGPFLDAMLAELGFLYNVDLNRVYLTGHSMGGYGTWHWGPEWAERWAAISPMAGGGGPAADRLQDTRTFVFVFHGADDNVVGVQGDRAAAEVLLKNGNDFAYTELGGVGHGCPEEVLREMADWFEVKRLAVRRGGKNFVRSDEVRSSFLEKPTKEEKDYLGSPELPDPKAAAETPEDRRARLLGELRLGGGRAEQAAAAVGEAKDAKLLDPVAALLRNAKNPVDVRSAAAKALGGLAMPGGLAALEGALGDESDPVYLAALHGVEAVADRRSGPALLKALDFQARRFADKLQGAGMDFSDYEGRCAALGATAKAAGALSEGAAAVGRIHACVVKPVLEARIQVPESTRVGQFPKVVKARLGRETAEALGRTGHATAVPVLRAVKDLFPGDGDVGAACDEALAKVGAGK